MLQHEWKPTIVLDLNLKSKVVNSSALGLWNCCSGESLSAQMLLWSFMPTPRSHILQKVSWRYLKNVETLLKQSRKFRNGYGNTNLACYMQELCACRSHSFIWTFFLMVLCAGSDEWIFFCFFVPLSGSESTFVTDLADFVCKGTFCAECSRFLVGKRENKATNISGGRFRNRIDLIYCNRWISSQLCAN